MAEVSSIEENSFNIGDNVQLKTGGPIMVIKNIIIPEESYKPFVVVCQWYIDGELKEESYNVHLLVKIHLTN